MRVKVFSTDGRDLVGYGDITKRVPVFAALGPAFVSYDELEPDLTTLPEGTRVVKLHPTPKIVMEDGTVRYGVHSWWEKA
jgi:hypothetical protein